MNTRNNFKHLGCIKRSLAISPKAYAIMERVVEITGQNFSEAVSLALEEFGEEIIRTARDRRRNPQMSRTDKISNAITKDFSSGQTVTPKQIVCSNHRNSDPFSGKHPVFEKMGRGKYRVI